MVKVEWRASGAIARGRERDHENQTPQEYIQRILAQLEGKDSLKVQAATAAKLGRLIQRASAAKLHKRPAPGKWSAGEILAHLADCEIVTRWRVRQIRFLR